MPITYPRSPTLHVRQIILAPRCLQQYLVREGVGLTVQLLTMLYHPALRLPPTGTWYTERFNTNTSAISLGWCGLAARRVWRRAPLTHVGARALEPHAHQRVCCCIMQVCYLAIRRPDNGVRRQLAIGARHPGTIRRGATSVPRG